MSGGDSKHPTNMQTEQTIALSTGVVIDAKNDLTGWTRTNLKEAVAITGASEREVTGRD